ncbi:hypothetical protein [uncultured Chryseobacterium sp.]|nr:hypothetical protein [uncultured Chryseobacterium sp.]
MKEPVGQTGSFLIDQMILSVLKRLEEGRRMPEDKIFNSVGL